MTNPFLARFDHFSADQPPSCDEADACEDLATVIDDFYRHLETLWSNPRTRPECVEEFMHTLDLKAGELRHGADMAREDAIEEAFEGRGR